MANNLTVHKIIRHDFLREYQSIIKVMKGGGIMHIDHRRIALT